MPTYGPEMEGKTATAKDGKTRIIIRNGEAVRDDSYTQEAPSRAKTTPKDMEALTSSSSRAAAERDAQRLYSQTGAAVDRMGGPVKAWWLDAITPEEDGGLLDAVGAVVGTPFRPLVSDETWKARDHLKTVNANVALAGSQQMKGSSSDKDTALMRLSGIGPYKNRSENRRIINEASYKSGLEQARALVTSQWIGKYGSVSNPSENGMTFEQALGVAERSYGQRLAQKRNPQLPKAPPRKRGGTLTIDLDGNPIE